MKKLRKILSLILVFGALLGMMVFPASAEASLSAQDSGSVENEIVISTPQELMNFAKRTQQGGDLGNCKDLTVKLANNIDMTGYDWYYRNAEGTVVTDYRIPDFIGNFNGQGFAVKNLSYRDEYAAATEKANLAFIIQGKSFMKNLTIDGITVNTVAPATFAGLIKDYAWSGSAEGTVENCYVKNVVVNAGSELGFGGMFARLVGGKAITNCHVENITINVAGSLSGENNRNGGFVGTGGEPMTFTDCSVSNLVINAESTAKYVGGFIGGASMSAKFYNCDVNGFALTASNKFSVIGGFAGYTAGSAWGKGLLLENCDVSGLDIENSARVSAAGGFIGYVYGQGKSLEDGAHHFVNCTAAGSITTGAESKTGGFIGWLYGRDGNGCAAEFVDSNAAVNVYSEGYGGAFAGYYVPYNTNKMVVAFENCTASGDVFASEPVGSFLDADDTTIDGIKGGTYNYDPENVDSATGETNNVAPGYRALDNGDGTWTVFPDLGKEVVKVAFHRWNDEKGVYENWRTVEVFKDVDFFESAHDNTLNYSHPAYRFANGIAELDEEADDLTDRVFSYWTDAPEGTALVLDNEIEVVADMDVYAAYVKYANVIVNYVDNKGNVLAEEEVQTLAAGSDYETTAKEIEGYQLTSQTGTASGVIGEEDVVVTYVYTKVWNLTVNFVDEEGNVLAEQIVTSELEGAEYTTEAEEIAGYILTADPENASGIIDGDETVTYIYTEAEEEIDDNETPKAPAPSVPETEDIPEEDTPLNSEPPKTGDETNLMGVIVVALASAFMAVLLLSKKKFFN